MSSSTQELHEINEEQPKIIERTIDDEMLLTELNIDRRNIVIYDISPIINCGINKDKGQKITSFKSFYDEKNNIFFIELNSQKIMLNKTLFLDILDIAEKLKVSKIYCCLRNNDAQSNEMRQKLQFVGFKKLTEQQQYRISITKTHELLEYSLDEEEDE